jgi:hypothetical protein
VVTPGSKCRKGELALAWSLQGPAGPAGAQGAKGATGSVDSSNFYDKSASDGRFLGTGATAANSNQLDGKDSLDFPARGFSTPTNQRQLAWRDYLMNTAVATEYEFDTIELHTNGVAGQFQVCAHVTLSANRFYVIYVNGTRSARTILTETECDPTVWDPGANGDFQAIGRADQIFGVGIGTAASNENYYIKGLSNDCCT